jgi:hypothetical protein
LIGTIVTLRGPREWSDSYQISIANLTHVSCAQREQSASPTGSRDEFDLEGIRLVDFDDRTKIAALESMLRQVAIENHGV